jgi:hypothetical protein
MQETRLTLKKRAFPSRGRARFNAIHLPGIGASDGGQADLINEATGTSVTVSIVADTMVLEGQVRVSPEDLETLGLKEGDTVLVRKTPPLNEKIRKVAEDAGTAARKHADSLDRVLTKTAGDMKAGAGKASDSIEKAARKTAGDVKKAVKKAHGDEDL